MKKDGIRATFFNIAGWIPYGVNKEIITSPYMLIRNSELPTSMTLSGAAGLLY